MSSTTVSSEVSAIWEESALILQSEKKYIVPEKREQFERDIRIQEADSDFLRSLCTYVEKRRGIITSYCNGKGAAVDAKLEVMQVKAEHLSRTLNLRALIQRLENHVLPEQDRENFFTELRKELLWKNEYGTEDDLERLEELKSSSLDIPKDVLYLIGRVTYEIQKRFYAPDQVLRREEAAYQLHKVEWNAKYKKRTYIAIHKGEVVAHAKDKVRLYGQLTKLQQQGRFRAYIVQIGAQIINVRGPRFRSRGRAKKTTAT